MLNLNEYIPYKESLVADSGVHYQLLRHAKTGSKKLKVQGRSRDFEGVQANNPETIICDLTHRNALALRKRFPWLSPQPLGIATSFGFGDRLGLATPGHILSIGKMNIKPVFAQQSVRENNRTGRSPQDVVDDAMWGVFQMGWNKPWGADADHLKTPDVIDAFIQANYTMFTIDPGDQVDRGADDYDNVVLLSKIKEVPWSELGWTPEDFFDFWKGKKIERLGIWFDESKAARAIVKYGKAIAHTMVMFSAIQQKMNGRDFDFEVSVDETDSPTSVEEHYLIVSELQRLGVRWTSLAPRFLGRFEKGVDFIGDLDALDQSIKQHAEVAKLVGGYKLSLHSGSDKFSVYPIISRYTSGLLHIKTAGTSYLESLRVIAEGDPVLFHQIFDFALSRYDIDKATYHVSGDLNRIPQKIANPAELLDQFDARQVFHVTYGSVLETFGDQFFSALRKNDHLFDAALKKHLGHHLELLQQG